MPSAAPTDAALDQPAVLAVLRARVARLEGASHARHITDAIPVCEGLPLPDGGVARAAMHEILSTSSGCGAAFCALLLALTGGTVLWNAAELRELLAEEFDLGLIGFDQAALDRLLADAAGNEGPRLLRGGYRSPLCRCRRAAVAAHNRKGCRAGG